MRHRMLPIAFSPTDPRCHGDEIWDKIGYNSACVRDFCETFAPIGGFSGMGHRMLPIAFFPDRPPLPWPSNAASGKRFSRDFCAYRGGFRGWAIKRCGLHFSPTDPRCHDNEIWDKIGYNSACVRDFCEIFAPIGRLSLIHISEPTRPY